MDGCPPYRYFSSAKGTLYVKQTLNCPEGIWGEWMYDSGVWTMPFNGQTVEPVGPPGMAMPYWSLVVSVSFPAVIPWIRWRFSLRTLLIVTTLVAVVLGLIVWLR